MPALGFGREAAFRPLLTLDPLITLAAYATRVALGVVYRNQSNSGLSSWYRAIATCCNWHSAIKTT